MSDTLIFDLSNLAYIGGFRDRVAIDQAVDKPMAIYEATVQFMRHIYRQFTPEKVWFACDHQRYWRTDVFPAYKANRVDHPMRQLVRAAIGHFKEKNAHLCIESEACEADDVIYGLSQHLLGRKIIISSDGDFAQLVTDDVRLFSPMKMAFQPPIRNPAFEMFLKCFRGDKVDNIPSAYPRVTRRVLQQAFAHPVQREKLMNIKLADGRLVGDSYQLNRTLIDLACIPESIQQQLQRRISQLIMNNINS